MSTPKNLMPKVSVVITTHNRKEKVLRTIQSVLSSNNPKSILEIIVIDDASTDETCKSIKSCFSKNGIRIFRCKTEKLVSACRNIGLKKAKGEFIFFLDDDVLISPETITELSKFLLLNEKVAVVLPLILYYQSPNMIWCAGVKHNFWTTVGKLVGRNELDQGQFKEIIHTDSVMTAFMVRKAFSGNVFFDSELFPIGWEDADYTTKIKRSGYDVVVLPWIKVWHDYPGAHFLKSNLRLYFEVRNRIIFHKKWSRNAFQYFFSVVFSLAVGLNYIVLSIFFSKSFFENMNTVFRALFDELFCSKKRYLKNNELLSDSNELSEEF